MPSNLSVMLKITQVSVTTVGSKVGTADGEDEGKDVGHAVVGA